MRELIFYGFLLLFCGKIQAQSLKSSITEKGSGAPVENAIVEISQTGLATKTRKDGSFVFNASIPEGEHVLTISKEGYITGFFLVKSQKGLPVWISSDRGDRLEDKIEIGIDKYETARRKRAAKVAAKEEAKRLKEAKKDKQIKDKLLAKKLKLLKKNKPKVETIVVEKPAPVVIEQTPTPIVENVITYSEAQYKFSQQLGVPLEELTNKKLYDFIDEWEGVPYKMGGEGRKGIDCSAFTQRLFTRVYSMHLERTADRQYNSDQSRKFKDVSTASEGDLIFFSVVGNSPSDPITHVGVYLHNNKFVSATSKGGRAQGVKITDITDPYWKSRLVSFARRVSNK